MSTETKKLLYVFTRAPYSNAAGQEALDAVLVGASFEQEVSVLFVYDGVFQVIGGQTAEGSHAAEGSGLKVYTKAFRALDDFGVEQVYAHDLSLAARGISADELIVDLNVLSIDAMRALLGSQDRVFTF